jgi:hypothetical protein
MHGCSPEPRDSACSLRENPPLKATNHVGFGSQGSIGARFVEGMTKEADTEAHPCENPCCACPLLSRLPKIRC